MTKTLKGNGKSSKTGTQKRTSKDSTSQKNGSSKSKVKNNLNTLSNKEPSSDESDSDVKQETSKSSESLSEDSAKNSDSNSESDEAHAILHNSQQKGSNHKQPMKDLAEDSGESSEEKDSDSSDSDGIGIQKKTNSTSNERSSSSSDSSNSSSSDNDSSEDEDEAAAAANKHKSSDSRSSTSEQSSSESDSESDSDSEAESIEGSQTRVSSSSNSSTSDDDSENDVDSNTVNNTNEKANKRKAPIQSPMLAKKAKIDDSFDYSSGKSSTVFVGGLSYGVDAEWLRRELAEAGEIVDVRIITDRETQRSKGFAYVDFASSQAAEAALRLSGKVINGRPIRVDLSQPKDKYKKPIPHDTSPAADTIFIGNLSFDANEEELRKFFKKAGEIVSIRLPVNTETQHLKGFGYVQFSNTNAAEKAMRLHGKNFMGRTIRLDYANSGRDLNNGMGNVGHRNNWGARDGRGGRNNSRGRGDGRGRGRGSYGGLAAAKNRGSIVAGQGSKIKFE